jgi:hypothetical protein
VQLHDVERGGVGERDDLVERCAPITPTARPGRRVATARGARAASNAARAARGSTRADRRRRRTRRSAPEPARVRRVGRAHEAQNLTAGASLTPAPRAAHVRARPTRATPASARTPPRVGRRAHARAHEHRVGAGPRRRSTSAGPCTPLSNTAGRSAGTSGTSARRWRGRSPASRGRGCSRPITVALGDERRVELALVADLDERLEAEVARRASVARSGGAARGDESSRRRAERPRLDSCTGATWKSFLRRARAPPGRRESPSARAAEADSAR